MASDGAFLVAAFLGFEGLGADLGRRFEYGMFVILVESAEPRG